MNAIGKARIRSGEPQYPISGSGPADWEPVNILYLKLIYEVKPSGLTFCYDDASGFYGIPSKGIDGFIIAAQAGGLGLPQKPITAASLDFKIIDNCYIVFDVKGNANWQFRTADDAITTNDKNANEYFDLYHVLSNGKKYPGPGLDHNGPSQTEAPCTMAFFSAKSPSIKMLDQFNLYIKLQQADGGMLNLVVDPDIQNTGHPFVGGGGDEGEP